MDTYNAEWELRHTHYSLHRPKVDNRDGVNLACPLILIGRCVFEFAKRTPAVMLVSTAYSIILLYRVGLSYHDDGSGWAWCYSSGRSSSFGRV
jgi:hypothetical protein